MKYLGPPQSGSARGDTASRNRFGQYLRNRASPVQPRTPAQLNQRARIATMSAAWRALTSGQRAGWASLGAMMTRTDALGQTYTLNGFMAFVSVNTNLAVASVATVDDAPALVTPADLATVTLTLTSASFSIAWTPTPLDTGVKLLVYASPQRSAGTSFEGDYRLLAVSAAAAASPLNVLSAYTAKWGAPVTGNRIFLKLQTTLDGFVGSPFGLSQVVA